MPLAAVSNTVAGIGFLIVQALTMRAASLKRRVLAQDAILPFPGGTFDNSSRASYARDGGDSVEGTHSAGVC